MTAVTGARWRCRLGAGVQVREVAGRAFLVGERPLTVLEVSRRGRRLLERVREPAGAVLTPAPAELRFLRRLADLGLLHLQPVPTDWPTVTVVVPVRDRPEELAACLSSLQALRYAGSRPRVCVVDDGSAVAPVVPAWVRLVRLPRSLGPGGARNEGAGGAGSELLAFLDSDCTVEPGWLEALVPELADPAVAAAGGRVLPASQRTWLERYEAVRSPLDLGGAARLARAREPVPYLVAANLVVRRSDFEAVGGFDPALRWGEDVDLCWRLGAAGRLVVYQPGARVRHRHRGAPAAFARTRAHYAASEAALLRRHPAAGRWLGFSPAMAAAAVAAIAALLGRPRLLAPAAVLLGLEAGTASARLAPLGVSRRRSLAALGGGQGNGLYHAARQLTRYYGLPAAAVAMASGRRRRRLLLGLALAEVVPATVDWWRLRPRLSLPAYVAAQVLDDVAYQCGLLAGCLRERKAAPLRVELRLLGRRG